MNIERMENRAPCSNCGRMGGGRLLITAGDGLPFPDMLTLCPECAARLAELLPAFGLPKEASYGQGGLTAFTSG